MPNEENHRLSRRDMIAKASTGAAMVWVTPAITRVSLGSVVVSQEPPTTTTEPTTTSTTEATTTTTEATTSTTKPGGPTTTVAEPTIPEAPTTAGDGAVLGEGQTAANGDEQAAPVEEEPPRVFPVGGQAPAPRPASGPLARTGSNNTVPLVEAGVALSAAGAALIHRARRRRAEEESDTD